MEKMKKRIKLKKGFTLVEIIVVLVILAILAAFTIPTMLGFVNDARGKAYIAEAREVYVAAQAVATEFSATTTITDANVWTGSSTGSGATSQGTAIHATGLGASLSSYEVRFRSDNSDYTDQGRASKLMYSYLSNDLPKDKIANIQPLSTTGFSNPKPTNNEAAWIVTVGDVPDKYPKSSDTSSTRTGKVTKVVYYRDDYKVTITGGNATVDRY